MTPTPSEKETYEWLNKTEFFDSSHRHDMQSQIGKIGLIVNQFLAEDPERREVTEAEIKMLVEKTKSHFIPVTYWLKRAQFRENKMLGSYFKIVRRPLTSREILDKVGKG